jgi:hypothetical protein
MHIKWSRYLRRCVPFIAYFTTTCKGRNASGQLNTIEAGSVRANTTFKCVIVTIFALKKPSLLYILSVFCSLGYPACRAHAPYCIYMRALSGCTIVIHIKPLTPNEPYRCSTAPLTSKRFILYIYSTNIGTEYFKHDIYSPFFPLQNAVCFIILTFLVPVLFTFYIFIQQI